MKKETENKDLTEYGYRGNEKMTLEVREFYALKRAVEKAVENGIIKKFPALYSWVDEKGNVKKKLTNKQKESGDYSKILDIDRTSESSNFKVDFREELFPEIMSARSVIQDIHARAVEEDVAVHRDILKEEQEKQKEELKNKESSSNDTMKKV